MKTYPNKLYHPGKGTVIPSHWNDNELKILQGFTEKVQATSTSAAMKIGVLIAANLIGSTIKPPLDIQIKVKKSLGSKKSEEKSE